ncbi:MAG TPA: ElyC/SanA/YdcF family protein [Candidatus Paceibacterota bacterium]|nr:ElyC/SanA/YdcF family protein [Candidatus Paceibacterota bacterium]
MRRLRRIVVVCGYGCDLNSELKMYLDRVLQYCYANRPDAVILCGGATQRRRFPHETEASVMQKYLGSLEGYCHPRWYILGGSYTAYENIRDAAAVIGPLKRTLQPDDIQITIFCEVTRSLKVAILARHFMGFPPKDGLPPIRIETDSWEKGHPTKQLFGAIKEVLAISFPFINSVRSAKVRLKSRMR